jgi:glycosyltransferase involved in cell wall biosynthesis
MHDVTNAALGSRPVSVLLPTLNERGFVRDCIASLLAQQGCEIDEILVVDGGSTDGTRDIVEGLGPPVRLVHNPGVTAAAAMNLGLAEARNDLVVRADAHTQYAPDYVERSLTALDRSGADWVGGPMVPVGANVFGRAVAAVTSSPFGIGPGRFHYATETTDVETVYLGTFDRRIVFEVGGYDEVELQWAAEDQELAFRLRRAGRRIHLDPAIRSWYVPRDSAKALWRQYSNYGMCKASTLRKHRTLPYWRPLVPAAMVAAAASWTLLFAARDRWLVALAPMIGYGVGAGAVAMRIGDQPGVAPHRAFLALSVCHWGYGLGFWRGVGRILTNRPFDHRPKGGRR